MNHIIDYEEVAKLQKECETRDGITLKLNWDMLNARRETGGDDLAEYRDGRLVAFLGIYDIAGKLEICGMVHPDYRRQGIFTTMLQKALADAESKCYAKILLNAPESSASAKSFIASAPFSYSFSESQMKYEEACDLRLPVRTDIVLRRAGVEDKAFMARVDREGFELSEEESLNYYASMDSTEMSEYEILLSDGEPAGKIRVSPVGREAWIYGFAVAEERRGQGIGKSALRQIVDREHAGGYEVWLEVAFHNPDARRLYEETGFRVVRAQDYYEFAGHLPYSDAKA